MFSVIIPTYNRLELLKRAINSVLVQTFQEFEIIIVDDCSSDGTLEWLKGLNNKKIKVLRNSVNKGLAYNRNYGASYSNFNFLAFLDDDDFWFNNHLSELDSLISIYPNAGMYCNSYIINLGDKKVNAKHDNKFLSNVTTQFSKFKCFKNSNALCAPSATVVRKDVFDNIGGFNPKTTVLEDVEFYIKLGTKYPIVHNRKRTIEYAQNTGNHLSLNHVHKKQLPDLSIFIEEENKYPYLKEWLDSIRFQIGMKFLEVGSKKYKNYFVVIHSNNLSYLKRIFINLNYGIMKFILLSKRAINKKGTIS